jgi:DNA-directed RNA polymerase subunit K/omega
MTLNLELPDDTLTEYEKSRIIGSRALQISQGAPLHIDLDEDELQELDYNPIEIAKKEFAEGELNISVNRERRLPKHRDV